MWEFENITYVQRNPDAKEALMETRTPGRIYATVGGNDIIRITLFDSDNKRNKVIEKDKRSGEWHVHNGYNHWEYSEKRHNPLGSEDQKLLDKVNEAWKNRRQDRRKNRNLTSIVLSLGARALAKFGFKSRCEGEKLREKSPGFFRPPKELVHFERRL